MANMNLLTSTLSLLMLHDLTGCTRAARQAAGLLRHLSDLPEMDWEVRYLCEQMSIKLDTTHSAKCAITGRCHG